MDMASEGFIARVGERSIILDLPRDKYLLLGKKLTDIALSSAKENDLSSGRSVDTPRQSSSASVKISAPAESSRSGIPSELELAATIPPPAGTLWPTRDGRLGLGRTFPQSVRALKCLYDVQRHLRHMSLFETIEYMRVTKRRCAVRPPSIEAQELMNAYHAARPWFWAAPICRLDALAIALLFWRSGLDANLVFGVRLEPFGAHCWAQAGRTALNEPHQTLFQYTQIMVI